MYEKILLSGFSNIKSTARNAEANGSANSPTKPKRMQNTSDKRDNAIMTDMYLCDVLSSLIIK